MLRTAPPLRALSLFAAPVAFAAQVDGTVTPSGLSHFGWHDRSPAVPVRGEAHTVRFQTLAGDLTGARVRQFVLGTPVREFEAQVVAERGPYAIWEAQVDGRDAPLVTYDIAVQDGADVDFIGVDGHGEVVPAGGPFVLDFDNWTHAPRGATPTSEGVLFKVWAPTAPDCFLRGSFNGWSLANPMTRVGEDYVLHAQSAQAGDEYKFFFNSTQTWKSDPNARRMVAFENAVVVDPEGYAWQSGPFTPPPFERQVHYQLHVGSFAGRNDPAGPAPTPSRFVDVKNRVAHLVDLGVNVVYLNPVDEWPSFKSGGYNPISYTAIEASYGTPDDLKALVDTLHQNGIAVILDVVPNHVDFSNNFLFGFQGPLSPFDNIYFDTPPYDTPWGPQLDFDREDVREYILEALVQKLEEYRFDGFRVDALSAMLTGPQNFWGREILRELNRLADRRWDDKFILAEEFSDDPFITRDIAIGGLGFDAQYHNAFKTPLRDAIFGTAFGNVNVGAVAFGMTRSDELSGTRAWHYFELHDEVWGLSGGGRGVKTIDTTFPHDDAFATGRHKLGHGLALLSKGVPGFVMGAEWLEDDEWEVQKIDWTHAFLYGGVLDYFRDLIARRTSEPALWADATARTLHLNDAADVFAVERSLPGGDAFVVVANFGPSPWTAAVPYRIGLPRGGTWGVVLNSDSPFYRGQGGGAAGLFEAEPIPYDGQPWSAALALPADGLLLLEHEPELLEADLEALSLAAGGTLTLAVDGTAGAAGDLYWVLGSLTGTQPGLPVGGLTLPLVPDAYFQLALTRPNQPPFGDSFGVFGPKGRATATVTLPAGLTPVLAGATLWHAAVQIDGATLGVERISAPVGLTLEP